MHKMEKPSHNGIDILAVETGSEHNKYSILYSLLDYDKSY